MRSTFRRAAAATVLLLAAVAFTATRSSAAPAVAGAAVRAATAPTAHLTGAQVSFHTNDEDKDADTHLDVTVFGVADRQAATLSGYFGHFNDGENDGPYAMFVDTGLTAADLSTGRVSLFLSPNGRDTWRFDYELTMTFSDGTSFVVGQGGLEMYQWNRVVETPFTLTTQVRVPDVRGLRLAAARTALQAAGLTAGAVSHRVDPACNYVGTVWEESPDVGAVVLPGAAIDLTIGDRPKGSCL
jgi:hypothetical protein